MLNKEFNEKIIFVNGEEYFAYRIPSLITTNSGALLAFCEGRKESLLDAGKIDLVLRRSADEGESWSEVCVVASEERETCGNPCPVVDRKTGAILLLFCKNAEHAKESLICEGLENRTVWIMKSTDEGKTWNNPKEITNQVKKTEWTWYATGPGHGIQMEGGRLIIPCNHILGVNYKRYCDPYHSHVIYSDDHGETWKIGGIVEEGSNESTILQRADGSLYINCRNPKEVGIRAYAISHDGGLTFGERQLDSILIEPSKYSGCEGSIMRLTNEKVYGKNRVLFSNPAASGDVRKNLSIKISYDECKTWTVQKVVYEGPSEYSDLAITNGLEICCLYEKGSEKNRLEGISFVKLNLEWLTDGQDSIK